MLNVPIVKMRLRNTMKPHKNMGPDYMHRWHLIPKNRWFNIFLHRIIHSDDARALHDHPWWSVSFLLKGVLAERWRCQTCGEANFEHILPRFWPVFRKAQFAHRLILMSTEAWTIFITGPRSRTWGFWIHQRWVSHHEWKLMRDSKKKKIFNDAPWKVRYRY